jgi:undecaprenyl-diphosphatase
LLPEPPPPPDRIADAPPAPPSAAVTKLPLPASTRRRLAEFDALVDRQFDRLRGHPTADRLYYLASELGDFGLVWHLIGTARALRSDRHTREALRLAIGLGAESLLVNGLIKSFFRRKRPTYEGLRPHRLRRPRSSSFPSGHASSAFFAAGLLGERSRWRPAWYGVAVVVATSRIHVKIHHASDVLAGMATGAVLARVVRRTWPVEA